MYKFTSYRERIMAKVNQVFRKTNAASLVIAAIISSQVVTADTHIVETKNGRVFNMVNDITIHNAHVR